MAMTADGTNGLASKITVTLNGASSSSPDAGTTTYPLLISNKPYTTKSSFPVHSPATGKVLHHFSSASIEDAEHAISAAQRAYPAWRALSPPKKRDILLRAAEIMDSRKELFIKACVEETGAEPGWGEFNHGLAVDMLKDIAGRLSSIAGTIPTTSQEGVSALVYKEPYGVILAIAPWNAPFILGLRSIAYPLAAGNTAILKAPELSPLCFTIIVSCFHDAGLPPGVLNLIAHQPSDAAAITKHLIEHPLIKKINFTGSTAVGKIIAKLAGENLKPVILELGGKAPAIVLEDADLEYAAMKCAVGAFLHSGQICMATERIIVHERIADAFEAEFKNAIRKFAPQDQEPGCLVSKVGVEKNKRLLSDAVAKGGQIIYGELASGTSTGATMGPVVVKGVKKDMDLFYTESFGPTVSLMVVKDDAEAVELANDTEYGLSAAVFTRDLGRALRIARLVESGAVHVNGMTVHDETALPHGGEFPPSLLFSLP